MDRSRRFEIARSSPSTVSAQPKAEAKTLDVDPAWLEAVTEACGDDQDPDSILAQNLALYESSVPTDPQYMYSEGEIRKKRSMFYFNDSRVIQSGKEVAIANVSV